MFKDGRLTKDPVLVELRKKYEENFGPFVMPPFHYEVYHSYEEYVQHCQTLYDKLLKERGESKEQ